MNFKRVAPIMLGLGILDACASAPSRPAPSPIGAAPAAPRPAASLLGAGSSFSDVDQAFMTQKVNQALEGAPSAVAVNWQNPDGGASVQFVPGRPYQLADNTYCRTFTETIIIKGTPEASKGTACRQSDGVWQAAG
jgi:hypothetical protein